MKWKYASVTTPLLALAVMPSAALGQNGDPHQEPSIIDLRTPDALAAEQFTLIKGFRELPDGRIMVTDWVEQRVVVLDLASGEVRDLGSVGGGPKEFRLPSQLIALPNDSTLLVDYGNARMTVLDPSLEFVRTMPLNVHGTTWRMSPRGAGPDGTLYFSWSLWSYPNGTRAPGPRDSVEIGRWSHESGLRTVGDVRLKGSVLKAGRSSSKGLPYVAFTKQDGFAVSPDGWVAVVRSTPFRVDWYGPNGEVVQGPMKPYAPIPVSKDDLRDHIRRWLASTATTGRGDGGGTFGLVPSSEQSADVIEDRASKATYEKEFPPFVPTGVWAPAPGVVWVQRWLPEHSVPTFDVFDRNGVRRTLVSLPRDRRIIGFGRDAVYATVADEDDLLTIERYPLP